MTTALILLAGCPSIVRAQEPPRFGLTIAPTVAIPFGRWYEGTGASVGVRFAGSIRVVEFLDLVAGFQYQPLAIDGDPAGVDLNVQKFVFGVHYIKDTSVAPLSFLAGTEIGAYRHVLHVSTQGFDLESTKTKFGTALVMGVLYSFSPKLGFESGARLSEVWNFDSGTVGYLEEDFGFLFELEAGLRISL